MRDGLHNGLAMTKAEVRHIRKYLGKIRGSLYDFSIDTDTWRAEMVKLEEVITEVMVASVDSDEGIDRIMLYYLEEKVRHCRTIILNCWKGEIEVETFQERLVISPR
jgi:hypothetical protein